MVFHRDQWIFYTYWADNLFQRIYLKCINSTNCHKFSLEISYTVESTSGFCCQIIFKNSFNSPHNQTKILSINSNMSLIIIYFLTSQKNQDTKLMNKKLLMTLFTSSCLFSVKIRSFWLNGTYSTYNISTPHIYQSFYISRIILNVSKSSLINSLARFLKKVRLKLYIIDC